MNTNIEKKFAKLKVIEPNDIQVQFFTYNVDEMLIPMCLSIDKLWADWYGDCNYVPENGAYIHALWIICGHTVDAVNNYDLDDFTFQDMMEIIREIWYKE